MLSPANCDTLWLGFLGDAKFQGHRNRTDPHYLSFSIIIYHHLYIIIYHYLSLSIIIYHLSIICLSSSVYIIIFIFLDYPITLPLFQGLHCRGRPLLPPHPPTGNPPASVDPGPEMPRCPSGCDIPQGLRTCSGCFLVTAKSSWLKCYIY